MSSAAIIAAIAGVVGAATGAMGAIQQGKAAKKAAEFNAATQRNQATAARQKAEFDAKRHRSQVAALLDEQQVGFAKGGVALEGTPLEVMQATAEAGELDAQAILYGGEVQATGYESQATLSILEGNNAKSASYFKAGSTLLTGAASTGLAYKQATNPAVA